MNGGLKKLPNIQFYLIIKVQKIYKELKKFNVLDKCDRNIVFEDLDATGYTVNREYFINCKAKEIRFDTCDYKNDKIKKCVVVFEYDDIINKL